MAGCLTRDIKMSSGGQSRLNRDAKGEEEIIPCGIWGFVREITAQHGPSRTHRAIPYPYDCILNEICLLLAHPPLKKAKLDFPCYVPAIFAFVLVHQHRMS